jgi:thiosulfate/3-mercaptopyruvate sulfurtransferase
MFTTLVSPAEVAAHLDDAGWIVFDCRFDLTATGAGRESYMQSHIPGARYLHLDEHLAGSKTGRNGRHPLPEPAAFCATLAALGMRNDAQAVAYDSSGGYYAARLWWMLRWIGHDACAVIDGGWDAWRKAGLPVTAQVAAPQPATFECHPRPIAVQTAYIQSRLGQTGDLVIDARSPDRFRGENETLDPVGGHIPGAANRFFKNNLTDDGRFKPPADLRREFAEVLDSLAPSRAIHQCGSGVTACHNLLAMEVAGLTGSRLYAGSWSEWCSDPARPVAR